MIPYNTIAYINHGKNSKESRNIPRQNDLSANILNNFEFLSFFS